jgi:glycosyltransferase involved in cell wall biosynthesis
MGAAPIQKKARILIVGASWGSLQHFRGPLIRALVARGHSVAAAVPDIPPDGRQLVESWGAQLHSTGLERTGNNPAADLRYLNGIRKLIAKEEIDLVLTSMIKPNIWGGFAAWLARRPSVAMIEGLGYYFTDGGKPLSFRQRVVRRLIRRLYALSNRLHRRIIFLNPDDVRDMTSAGCLADPTKVRLVAGTGIDRDHYAPAPLPEGPRFLMISRLLKNKGVREFGEAAVRLKSMMQEAQFDLVGIFDEGPDGVDRSDLDRWIAGGLTYLGPQPDVRPAIAAANVYVLPSYREGTPRSSLEAMAMGRPIITSDAPGCRETVIAGKNGLLTPVRDVDALVDAMRKLAEDPALRARMGTESLELARIRFDVATVNADIIATLEEAL